MLQGTLTDPDGDTVRLQVEVRPVGTGFSAYTNQTSLVASGSSPQVASSTLSYGGYHWQARTVDSYGVASAWVSYGANPEASPDFSINQSPGATSSLAQYRSDGTTVIATGATTTETTVILRGVISDPDGGTVKMQIEIRPVGTGFTAFTNETALMASGSTASITLSGLSTSTGFHWRARAVDSDGLAGAWTSYGGNPESSNDFYVNGAPPAPTSLAQFLSDGTTSIPTGGNSTTAIVALQGVVSDPDGDTVRLQIEVRAVGTGFSAFTNQSSLVASGSTVQVLSSALAVGSYHWQARTVDSNGIASGWVSYGGNPESSADFSVNQTPNATASLAQYRSDGATSIATGATTPETTVILRGVVSDPDGGTVKMQVEVRAVGTSFTGFTDESSLIASGGTASVTVAGLTPGTQYHWRARAVDSLGLAGAWTSYGGNSESVADFAVNGPPSATSGLAQYRSDGTTSIGIGGTTTETTVILRGVVSDPQADTVKMQLEVRAVGTGFTAFTHETALMASGSTASITVTGLVVGTDYHWQARTVDSWGAASAWTSFGANPESSADFSCIVAPNGAPGVPTGVGQWRSDGITSIAVNTTTTESTVVFKATLSDPDANSVRLLLELRTLATPLTSTATHQSAFVASGTEATITVSGLADGSYHWRFAAEDSLGAVSSWTSFGGNPDTQADFTVNTVTNNPPADPTGVGQFSQGGVGTGGTAYFGTVEFRATLTDPDGNTVQLEIEVRPLGIAFSNVANATSALVASGAEASVSVGSLDGNYHWQYRAVDSNGDASAWTSFGGNPETDADVFVTPSAPPSGGGGGGGGGGGCGAAPNASGVAAMAALTMALLVLGRRLHRA